MYFQEKCTSTCQYFTNSAFRAFEPGNILNSFIIKKDTYWYSWSKIMMQDAPSSSLHASIAKSRKQFWKRTLFVAVMFWGADRLGSERSATESRNASLYPCKKKRRGSSQPGVLERGLERVVADARGGDRVEAPDAPPRRRIICFQEAKTPNYYLSHSDVMTQRDRTIADDIKMGYHLAE